jgi:hypothetical protein
MNTQNEIVSVVCSTDHAPVGAARLNQAFENLLASGPPAQQTKKSAAGCTWHVVSAPLGAPDQETVIAVCRTQKKAEQLRAQYASENSLDDYWVRQGAKQA